MYRRLFNKLAARRHLKYEPDRRWKSHLFNLLAAMSLILFLAAVYSAIKLQISENESGPPGLSSRPWRGGFWEVNFMWYLVAALSILPMVWIPIHLRIRRYHRTHIGPVCGYDLLATPDRCPEGGTAPKLSKG